MIDLREVGGDVWESKSEVTFVSPTRSRCYATRKNELVPDGAKFSGRHAEPYRLTGNEMAVPLLSL